MSSSTQESPQSADVSASSPDELLQAQSSRAIELKRWAVRGAIAVCLALVWIAITAQSTANV